MRTHVSLTLALDALSVCVCSMLETGNGHQAAHANGNEGTLTLDESITEFSMWAISASPLVSSSC
jgi:hypothetical protein